MSRRRFIGVMGTGALVAGCGTVEPLLPETPGEETGGGGGETTGGGTGGPDVTEPEGPVTPVEPVDPVNPGPTAPRSYKAEFLNRVTFGPTMAEMDRYDAIGQAAYLEEQLHPELIQDDPQITSLLSTFWTLTATPTELLQTRLNEAKTAVPLHMAKAKLVRAVLSRRQLFERMVEFWSDHFNVAAKGYTFATGISYDQDVMRVHALGKFRDLLMGVAKHVTMLEFLDNNLNFWNYLNENYARELLELHTVGLNNGYTHQDIINTARAFTGWRSLAWSLPHAPNDVFQFAFYSSNHDPYFKNVMGLQLPANGGIRDGEKVIEFLSTHPFTARHLATKLLKFFISETPSEAAINRVASAYLASDTDIRETLRAVFSEETLSEATPLLCRPFHLTAKAIRQTGSTMDSTISLEKPLVEMEHMPNGWTTPDGYPMNKDYWSSGILKRWNFGFKLAKNEYAAIDLPLSAATAPGGQTSVTGVIDGWNERYFQGRMTNAERQALINYANNVRGGVAAGDRDLFGMMLSLPSYQQC
ncbi:MAG TPA: DUF1800 domain-containing protein [Phycisphaerae bacterium]|nr:DUF1800 domain-containing protein [Phycisphaerae bacterium]